MISSKSLHSIIGEVTVEAVHAMCSCKCSGYLLLSVVPVGNRMCAFDLFASVHLILWYKHPHHIEIVWSFMPLGICLHMNHQNMMAQ